MATEQPPATLPATVENLINQICVKQSQPPLDPSTKRLLATIGENQALQILNVISNTTIRTTFNAFTLYMISKHSSPSQSPSPSQSLPSSSQLRTSPLAFPSLEDSGVLTALGELEFRKSFLMLTYAGGVSIENVNVVTAEYVRSLKDLPLRNFESKIWEDFGKCYYGDRRLPLEWGSGSTPRYECYVSPNGSLRFKGPCLQTTRTHLQKSLGDDNVLLVKFMDPNERKENSVQEAYELYGKFGKEGIRVGLRLYRFFGNPVTC